MENSVTLSASLRDLEQGIPLEDVPAQIYMNPEGIEEEPYGMNCHSFHLSDLHYHTQSFRWMSTKE
jgi:hypothetical protein